jgi:hypothetical protein
MMQTTYYRPLGADVCRAAVWKLLWNVVSGVVYPRCAAAVERFYYTAANRL